MRNFRATGTPHTHTRTHMYTHVHTETCAQIHTHTHTLTVTQIRGTERQIGCNKIKERQGCSAVLFSHTFVAHVLFSGISKESA